ncbi:hypothetical protein [Propionispira raffinosivorans]|nr:hypothetical protein [Propionispira raffinosivorans]
MKNSNKRGQWTKKFIGLFSYQVLSRDQNQTGLEDTTIMKKAAAAVAK